MPLDGADPSSAPVEAGCLYLDDDMRPCGCLRRPRSPYCPKHHAVCYVAEGSQSERKRLAEIDSAAEFVGGRVARASPRVPPQRFMRALDERQRKRLPSCK